jgi:hypothetical protein
MIMFLSDNVKDDDFEGHKQKMLDELKIKWYDIVIVVVALGLVAGWFYYNLLSL